MLTKYLLSRMNRKGRCLIGGQHCEDEVALTTKAGCGGSDSGGFTEESACRTLRHSGKGPLEVKNTLSSHRVCTTHRPVLVLLLQPIKICILGPPAVGKSSIAEALAKHYKLHHIKLKDVISEAIAKLVTFLTASLGIFISQKCFP